jgi:phthalate 4,5-cis-dihydrodiol dehydrogenase
MDSPLRLGVAGLGRAFTLMLPTFTQDPRVRLVAAADRRPDARARFAAELDANAYTSVEALCADPAVEVVYLATPHEQHAEHAMLAADAGKHLLIEKPLAHSLEDGRAILAAAERAGVQLVVGHSHSFDAPIRRTAELIADGTFGRVRMLSALNYTDFLYRPRRPEELVTAQGGGVVFSQGAHQIDIVRRLAGSPVQSVRAAVGAWDAARPTEGAYSALLGFESGAFASVVYSGYGHFDSDEFCGGVSELGRPKSPDDYGAARRRLAALPDAAAEAAFKNARSFGGADYAPPAATALVHEHFGLVLVSLEQADLRPLPTGVLVYADAEARFEPLPVPHIPRAEVVDELVAAVRHGRPPVHGGRSALATLEVCLALLRSAREQREIRLTTVPAGFSPKPSA